MEFHAAVLAWDDRQFGDVRAKLQKLDDGVSLKQLTATGATWSANASGEWRGRDGGTSRIRGTITSTDVGDTLKELGFAPVLQAKTGHVEFDMTWAGAPGGDARCVGAPRPWNRETPSCTTRLRSCDGRRITWFAVRNWRPWAGWLRESHTKSTIRSTP